MIAKNLTLVFILLMLLSEWRAAYPLEDSVVLPKGVRRLMINTVHTGLRSQSDQFGNSEPLAHKLERDVSFEEFIKVREGIDKFQLQAFLKANDIPEDQVVGRISADMKGKVDVFAPSFSFGITDRFSLGIAVPIYRAVTDVSIGFTANQNADNFIQLLSDDENGQTSKSHEAVDALNTVADTLNNKLEGNGYQRLGRWEGSGVGDIFIKGKYLALDTPALRSALNFVVTMPTGRKDDPDILTDVAFGDGSWDLASGFSLDELIGGPFFFNQYAMYTAQLPAKKTVRMKTDNEPLVVEKKEVAYDLGDKIDAGASFQWDTLFGLVGGLGYGYQHKFKDQYHAGNSSKEYERGTTQTAHNFESTVGYSAVNAYRAKKVAVPFAINVGYLRQLQSRNLPMGDRVQFDAKVFF